MANSESDDFESADEDVPKLQGNEDQPCSSQKSAATAYMYETKNSTVVSEEKTQEVSISPVQEANCTNSLSQVGLISDSSEALALLTCHNPDSLGAKPKVPQKNKSKIYSKHISHEAIEAKASVKPNITCSVNQDKSQKRKSSSSKLGVKISTPKLPCEDDIESDNNRAAVAQSENVSNFRADEKNANESIQPLFQKLASLDVSNARDGVTHSPEDKPSSGWGAWGSWGMNTIMSGASSVTSHVSQGFSTVSSVIEAGLGAVDPQEMARINVDAKKSGLKVEDPEYEISDLASEEATPNFNVVGNVLKFVESTGEMIVASGLNTLESLGKKTMDVLQEGDPGLKKKRALFSKEPDRPTLSQILKEARNKADTEDKEIAQAKSVARAHFETLFDDFKGMIHLEALEMLSNTCQLKLEAKLLVLSGTPLVEFQRKLIHIKEQCDIPDDDDEDDDDRGSVEVLERDLAAAMQGLMIPLPYTKLIRVSEETDAWLATMRCIQDEDTQNDNDGWADEIVVPVETDPQSTLREIHQQAIRALAQFTAAVAEHFHKTAELLLLKEEHDSSVESNCIVMMTSVLCSRVSSVAARFSELLSASANVLDSTQVDHNDVNSLITNVFLEASNSSSYIQDASMLLIPVLQLGAAQ